MPRLDEKRIHHVLQLHRQGMKWRAIARALGISRNTVRQIVHEHAGARQTPHSALPTPPTYRRASKLDPLRPQIDELLRLYPNITAQRVFECRREKDYDGAYTVVKDLVRRLRPKKAPQPSLQTAPRQPADMAECDWSPYKVTFTHAPSATLQAFGYTLRYSTRKFYSFHDGNGLHPSMDGHRHAFERFAGVAHRCKYDSQKPVVLRWEGNQPIYNPRFIDFATHYEFLPVACRRGHPNDKPRVERSSYELTLSFFRGRSFRDRADLLVALAHALAYGALEHGAVERIVLARSNPRRLDEYVTEQSANKLRRVLGESSTEPRDLAEYDALPCRGSAAPEDPGDPTCPEKARLQAQKSARASSTTSTDSD
jgi:transposase